MSELIYFVKNKFVRNVLVLVFVFTIFGESRLRCEIVRFEEVEVVDCLLLIQRDRRFFYRQNAMSYP